LYIAIQSKLKRRHQHILGYFEDESFQSITDIWTGSGLGLVSDAWRPVTFYLKCATYKSTYLFTV